MIYTNVYITYIRPLKGSGKVEVEIERFISCVSGAASNSAPSLIKIPWSLLIPGALFALVFASIFRMKAWSTSCKLNMLGCSAFHRRF